MSNISVLILVLTVFLLNLGAILTSDIYLRSIKKFQRRKLFCGNSLINPYHIVEKFIPLINIT